jgi:hypothetical protein
MKLTTGETLFVEIDELTDYSYVIKNPRLVRLYNVGPGGRSEGFGLVPWVPFTDDEIFEIKDNIVYYIGELNESCIKFYGATLMREEIAKLNMDGKKRLEDGEYGFTVFKEVLQAIRELGEDYSIKYGISPTEHTITEDDLSENRVLN